MATRTVTIYASGSARTDSVNPNIVNTKEQIGVFDVVFGNPEHNGWWDGIATYEQFTPPKEILGKRVTSAVLHIYVSCVYLYDLVLVRPILHSWDPKYTTWNNSPQISKKYLDFRYTAPDKNFQWAELNITNEINWEYLAKLVSFGFVASSQNGLKYYTANSDKKPYIVLTYEDNASAGLYAESLRPNDCFQDNRHPVPVSWSPQFKAGTIEPTYYQKIIASWRSSAGSYTKDITNDATLPSNQLPEQGTVTWSVTITDTAGNVNASETATFYTTDSTLYAYPVAPINAYLDGSKTVDLNWRWSISTGTRPTRADFQVSDDGGTTWDDLGTVTNQNDLTYHTAPNELPAGNILWRVRGYNTDSQAGPWSTAAAVVVRRAPNTPVISGVTGNPKPAVTWQAEGQQAYQLQIGPWDSGAVFGTDKTDQCPEFLPDGPAAVRLRVQNSFGMWSAWAETSVTIQNRPGADITATARAHKENIRLNWVTDGNYPEYIIYRAGELVGVTAEKEFIDQTGNGKVTYIVRGVNPDSTYTDSSPVTEILRLKSGFIAIVGTWEWLPLKCLRGRYPQIETAHEAEITYTQFSGRHLPVSEISGHYTKQHTLEFTLRNREEKKSLAAMVGKQVVYKDFWGRLIVGIMENLDSISDWASDVSFTITEVDHGPVL